MSFGGCKGQEGGVTSCLHPAPCFAAFAKVVLASPVPREETRPLKLSGTFEMVKDATGEARGWDFHPENEYNDSDVCKCEGEALRAWL